MINATSDRLLHTALVLVSTDLICAASHNYDPPGVKHIGPTPVAKLSSGKPGQVECSVGYVGTKTMAHNNQTSDAFLYNSNWQLSLEMRIEGKLV